MMKFSGRVFLSAISLFLTCGSTSVFGAELSKTAVDDNGNIVMVWLDYINDSPVLKTNIKCNGSDWTAPESILVPNDSLGQFEVKAVANGADISAVILWASQNEGVTSLFSAMRPSLSSSWTPFIQVSNANEDVCDPSFHLVINNSSKNITAMWKARDALSNAYHISSAESNGFNNVWTSPNMISSH